MKLLFTAMFCICISFASISQSADTLTRPSPAVSPIPIEALATDKAINFQMIVNKPLSPGNKFGFFSVVNLLDTYENDKQKNEFMVLSTVSYQIIKGVSVHAGLWTNNMVGARPTLALNYTLIRKNYLLICVPRVDLTQDHDIENVLIFEFYPRISDHWGLYNRIQGLYNYNTEQSAHDRSYVYLRLGTSYKKLRFGAGTNVDYYGPEQIRHTSWGLFVGTLLL